MQKEEKMEFQTEYDFVLPRGYIDKDGNVHNKGTMRLANAGDEIIPMKDPKVQQNPTYLTIILLSRVITKIGTCNHVDTLMIERLYTADLAYLQDFYQRINNMENPVYECHCPNCQNMIEVPINFLEAT